MRRILLLLLLAATPAAAQSPLPLLESAQWPQAQAAAAPEGPLAEKLVTWYRLLAPNGASAQEIAAFGRQNPDWPLPTLLERRRQDAIAATPDDASVAALCLQKTPTQTSAWGQALLRCADALANTGHGREAGQLARDAWVNAILDEGTEAAFIRRFPGLISPADQWARFQRLAWADPIAARRQIANLDPAHAARAAARLALKANDTSYRAPPAEEPGAMLDLARAYRNTGQYPQAVALWRTYGAAAQRAAPDHLAAFWTERHALTRALLHVNDPRNAYDLVAAHGQTDPSIVVEAEFLAGFIALRRLHDPAAATWHFTRLQQASPAVLTQSRAHYWLGQAAQAAGRDGREEFARAAAFPMTFYGQLGALAAGEPPAGLINALRVAPPPPGRLPAAPVVPELARAAGILAGWGDARRARAFLLRIEELAHTPAERVAVGDYAARMGLPDIQVTIARRLGRDGVEPPPQGWPIPYEPPPVLEPAFSLSIMRQESNFDLAIVSGSGARGLMQLMPATAATVAKEIGAPVSIPSLTVDPAYNMRLGTAYLREVLEKFDNFVPLAAAAYNAGPHRVTQWLADNGDPRVAGGMIDWIETIPFNETRNYVQRVLENLVVYQARRTGTLPVTMPQWSR
jgi:soluble lytic murein transglycosylase